MQMGRDDLLTHHGVVGHRAGSLGQGASDDAVGPVNTVGELPHHVPVLKL